MKLIKIGSGGCGGCNRMSHYDEALAKEYGYEWLYLRKGTAVYTQNAELIAAIREHKGSPLGFPTYAIMDGDTIKKVFAGGMPKNKFREQIEPREEEVQKYYNVVEYGTQDIWEPKKWQMLEGYCKWDGPDMQSPVPPSGSGWQSRQGKLMMEDVIVVCWKREGQEELLPIKPDGPALINTSKRGDVYELEWYREKDTGGGGDGGDGGGPTDPPPTDPGPPADPCEGVECPAHQICRSGKCADRCPDPCLYWDGTKCAEIITPPVPPQTCPPVTCDQGIIGFSYRNGYYGATYDQSRIRNVTPINVGDLNERAFIVEFRPGACDPEKIANSFCVVDNQTAQGNAIINIDYVAADRISEYVYKVTVVGEYYNNCTNIIGNPNNQGFTAEQKATRDPCKLKGMIFHGGQFENRIRFEKEGGGHAVEYVIPKGTWFPMDEIEALETGVRYNYKLWSNCTWDDGSISDKCGWCQRVEDGGRKLRCEDLCLDKPENHNYEDLQIHLDEGYGHWSPTSAAEGYIDIPDVCGEPPPDPPACGGQCPAGTECVDGKCQYTATGGAFFPAAIRYECCPDCKDHPQGGGNIDGNLLGCDNRPDTDPVPGTDTAADVYLYDRLNHTYQFCCPILADVTWLLPFDALPPVFQRYITTVASVRAAAQMVDNPQLFQLLKDRENILRMECNNYEMEQGDLNYLNQPDHSHYLSYQTIQTLNR